MRIESIDQLQVLLGINHRLRVSSFESPEKTSETPYWFNFLIALGWYLRRFNSQSSNNVCFLSLPNRTYAASLIAFGAEIAGAQIFTEGIDWDYLKNLEPGTEVYLYDKKSKKVGQTICVVQEKYEIGETLMVPLVYKNDKNKTTHAISIDHIDQYTITNIPITDKTRIALNKNGKFLNSLLQQFDYRWMVTSSIDSVIAGDAETLKREASSIFLSYTDSDSKIKLSNLIGLEAEAGVSHSKTGVIKPRSSQMQEIKAPMCILNGPIAIKSYAECKAVTGASSLVFVADHTESTEDYQRLLSMWGKGTQFGLNNPQDILIDIPGSVECAIFSVV